MFEQKMYDQVKVIHTAGRKKTVRELKLDMPRWLWLLVKFFLYGGIGIVLEVIFTSVVRLLHLVPAAGKIVSSFTSMSFPEGIPDQMAFPPQYMFAMSSVWMILVYGSGIFAIEGLYGLLKPDPKRKLFLFRPGLLSLAFRALVYAVAILAVEFVWGWFFRLVLGGFVWQYNSILVTTTPSILPYWFFAGIAAETVVKKMSEKDLEYAFRTDYEIPMPGARGKKPG